MKTFIKNTMRWWRQYLLFCFSLLFAAVLALWLWLAPQFSSCLSECQIDGAKEECIRLCLGD